MDSIFISCFDGGLRVSLLVLLLLLQDQVRLLYLRLITFDNVNSHHLSFTVLIVWFVRNFPKIRTVLVCLLVLRTCSNYYVAAFYQTSSSPH